MTRKEQIEQAAKDYEIGKDFPKSPWISIELCRLYEYIDNLAKNMKTVKASQQFIKLHQSDDKESVTFIKAKEIGCIESDGNGGAIIVTQSTTCVVRESPEDVLQLMDDSILSSSQIFTSQIQDLFSSKIDDNKEKKD